jgi:hypothetical protein
LAATSKPRYNESMKRLLAGLGQGLLMLVTGFLAAAEACGGTTVASSGDGGSDGEEMGDGCVLTNQDQDGGCQPPVALQWAEWPMPNSLREVEGGAPNLESYTDNQDGTVTDKVTKLMWQKESPDEIFTWDCAAGPGTAQGYCASLTLAGHTNWHLPTYIELISLLDYTAGGGRGVIDFDNDADTSGPVAIDRTYFNVGPTNLNYATFWSSTPLDAVDFFGASPTTFEPTMALSVRCVR